MGLKRLFGQVSRRAFFGLVALTLTLSQTFFAHRVFATPEYADLSFGSVSSAGAQWISGDGRYIGLASHLDQASDGLGGGQFIRDRQAQTITRSLAVSHEVATIMAISEDLRFAAIMTSVGLIPEDTNGLFDVYVLDRQNNTYELISRALDGGLANNYSEMHSEGQAISADGRYVAFTSYATNLVDGSDNNNTQDVFLRDRLTNTTTRVSENSIGDAANGRSAELAISDDGSTFTYSTWSPELIGVQNITRQIIVQDRITGERQVASTPQNVNWEPNSGTVCMNPSISADGRYVAFKCDNQQMLPNVSTDKDHVYRYDKQSGELRHIDVTVPGFAAADIERSKISGDGERIVYRDLSYRMFVWDGPTGQAAYLAGSPTLKVFDPIISADGLVVAAPHQVSGNGVRTEVWTLSPIVTDETPPSITPSLNPAPNQNGWHNSSATLSWTVVDPESPVLSQDGCDSVTADSETAGTTFTCTAISKGGTASESITIKYDATAPTLGSPTWSDNPQTEGLDATLIVPVSDTLSGIAQGEYFIGEDPGEGNAIPANWNGTNLFATFGAELAPGTYTVGIRAKDNASNWSGVTTTELVIESPDTTPPVIDSLDANYIMFSFFPATREFTMEARDDESGLAGGEFYIDADPGVGNGVPMTINGSTLSGVVPADVDLGVHQLYVRVRDNAGNWSTDTFQWFFFVGF